MYLDNHLKICKHYTEKFIRLSYLYVARKCNFTVITMSAFFVLVGRLKKLKTWLKLAIINYKSVTHAKHSEVSYYSFDNSVQLF